MRFAVGTVLALLLAGSPALAIDPETGVELTRVTETGAARPHADLSELGWLAGTWEGAGIEGATSREHWGAPIGGAMPGYFVQSDGKGGTMFSEWMQIAPDGDSLVVRLKHFNPDLSGWEEKDKVVSFPLIARDGDSWYFNGLTYRRQGDDRLLVAVRMKHDDGSKSELVFRFRRVTN